MYVQPVLIAVGIVMTVSIILLVACILICKKLVGPAQYGLDKAQR